MFKIGDKVRIPAHAQGTVWDSGVIEHINAEGAFVTYPATQRDPNYRLGRFTDNPRIPLDRLEPYAK